MPQRAPIRTFSQRRSRIPHPTHDVFRAKTHYRLQRGHLSTLVARFFVRCPSIAYAAWWPFRRNPVASLRQRFRTQNAMRGPIHLSNAPTRQRPQPSWHLGSQRRISVAFIGVLRVVRLDGDASTALSITRESGPESLAPVWRGAPNRLDLDRLKRWLPLTMRAD